MVEENARFEIKPIMLQMIQNAGKFGGLQGEDLHAHLTSFVKMCGNFSIPSVTPEGIRLYLFPCTLQDEAKRWAQSLESDEINAWEQLVDSLDRSTQAVADASTAGGLMDKTYTEAKLILDRISRNTNEWIDNGYEERGSKQRRAESAIVPADTMSTLAAQMAAVTSLL
ncbi:uncharacterized protein LOC120084573 [Benincasa hispida]|uniref:uncharacterized protein LOC120084573 n=1 Tax=Benincasa hispida TaxID=102211 RepID=UPI001900CA37|nr:uncharacterized protein LOC120084573 [Benincasa hispida]